ncbi:hypothetical protein Vi05172_g2171 [Venturia inaequalis]|nr:hypothetical protein Vi05172_g2171 [Venturia inaequalis]
MEYRNSTTQKALQSRKPNTGQPSFLLSVVALPLLQHGPTRKVPSHNLNNGPLIKAPRYPRLADLSDGGFLGLQCTSVAIIRHHSTLEYPRKHVGLPNTTGTGLLSSSARPLSHYVSPSTSTTRISIQHCTFSARKTCEPG